MNEVTLKGMFLKELYKGRRTKVCLFYAEGSELLAIGVNSDEEIEYKTDCVIKVSVEGKVKQNKKGMPMYDNHLRLIELNYIAGVEK